MRSASMCIRQRKSKRERDSFRAPASDANWLLVLRREPSSFPDTKTDNPGESCTDTEFKNGFVDTDLHVVGPWFYINSAHLMHDTFKTVTHLS